MRGTAFGDDPGDHPGDETGNGDPGDDPGKLDFSFFKIGYMGHFFFKFKSGGLKTQRFSMFSETDPLPNLAAQKKLAFCRRKTPIHFARPETA